MLIENIEYKIKKSKMSLSPSMFFMFLTVVLWPASTDTKISNEKKIETNDHLLGTYFAEI